jgi:hypothetical protein
MMSSMSWAEAEPGCAGITARRHIDCHVRHAWLLNGDEMSGHVEIDEQHLISLAICRMHLQSNMRVDTISGN